MKKIILSAIFATSACSAIITHAAGTDSAQFQVSITVLESCEISKEQDVVFAEVNRSTKAGSTAKGQLNVTCTKNTPYDIALKGTGQMKNENGSSLSVVPYKLYQDPARQNEWNDTNVMSNKGSGKAQAIPVYAKLAGDTNVEAGTYADTVTATITY